MGVFHFYDFIAVTVLILLAALSSNEIVLGQLERDLGSHMVVEHVLFISIGMLSVYVSDRLLRLMIRNEKKTFVNKSKLKNLLSKPFAKSIEYWKVILRVIFRLNTHPWIWIGIAGSLVLTWHIPPIFDYASIHEYFHAMQHLSFIVIGVATFMTVRLLGESFNLFLIFSLIAMMGFSGLILVISENQIYQVYSISSHHNAGILMIISFVTLLLVIMPTYLIRRTMFHINTATSSRGA